MVWVSVVHFDVLLRCVALCCVVLCCVVFCCDVRGIVYYG